MSRKFRTLDEVNMEKLNIRSYVLRHSSTAILPTNLTSLKLDVTSLKITIQILIMFFISILNT